MDGRLEILEEVAKLAHHMHDYDVWDDRRKMAELLRKLGFKLDGDD